MPRGPVPAAAPAGPPATEADTASESRPHASWETVDRALAAGEEVEAQRALEALAASSDPTTRAKALLGLAQLAAARGDCRRARTLAAKLARTPDVSPQLASRARNLARDCR